MPQELSGVFFLFFGIIVLLSLLTFDANDRHLNHVMNTAGSVHNSVGVFGAYLSGLLVDFFGLSAYCIPLLLLFSGGRKLLGRPQTRSWRGLSIIIFWLCLAGLSYALNLGLGDVRGGGLLGVSAGRFAIGFLSPVGASLLAIFLLLFATQLYFNFSWFALANESTTGFLNIFRAKYEHILDVLQKKLIRRSRHAHTNEQDALGRNSQEEHGQALQLNRELRAHLVKSEKSEAEANNARDEKIAAPLLSKNRTTTWVNADDLTDEILGLSSNTSAPWETTPPEPYEDAPSPNVTSSSEISPDVNSSGVISSGALAPSMASLIERPQATVVVASSSDRSAPDTSVPDTSVPDTSVAQPFEKVTQPVVSTAHPEVPHIQSVQQTSFIPQETKVISAVAPIISPVVMAEPAIAPLPIIKEPLDKPKESAPIGEDNDLPWLDGPSLLPEHLSTQPSPAVVHKTALTPPLPQNTSNILPNILNEAVVSMATPAAEVFLPEEVPAEIQPKFLVEKEAQLNEFSPENLLPQTSLPEETELYKNETVSTDFRLPSTPTLVHLAQETFAAPFDEEQESPQTPPASAQDTMFLEEPEEFIEELPKESPEELPKAPPINPRLCELPNLELLENIAKNDQGPADEVLDDKARSLMACLSDFGVQGELIRIVPGPVVTMFEVKPAPGVRVARIANLNDDLALALKSIAVRIQAPIPGSDAVGIEIPNDQRETVSFRDILDSQSFNNSESLLTMALGKDIAGNPVSADLAKMPHLLVAGATGAGKSVCLNSILLSLLYKAKPHELQLLLIDPKRIEMAVYAELPHLVHPVVTEMGLAKNALEWAVAEMDRRYTEIARLGVRNILGYNQKLADMGPNRPPELAELEPLPYMVIIIDELADLMLTAAKDVETSIVRLAQLARAAGIHLIIATQRPSVDVVTGLIKANFPCRISFQVTSKHDSRTILDTVGAEHLLGKGDMLFKPSGGKFQRLHGAFVNDDEVARVADFWRAQLPPAYKVDFSSWGESTRGGHGSGDAIDNISSDPMYAEAVDFVLQQGKASISLIQRRFRIGFNRAARYVEQMEHDGLIGPSDGSKPRLVIR